MTQIFAACIFLVACGLAARASSTSPPPQAPTASVGATPTPQASAVAPQPPAWDVSTIKPASPDARGSMIQITPDGIKITNVPLWTVVREAFRVQDDRLIGGPSWSKTSMFDIEAKVAPEDAAKVDALKLAQRWQMVVALLEGRFGLKYHHETRDLPMYELVVAKGGVKMQASKPNVDAGDAPPAALGQPPKPGNHMLMMHGRGHIESVGTGMSSLAGILSGQLGRTVVDKTGLTGNFDYKLDWTPDNAVPAMTKSGDPAPGDNASDSGGPSLFTALEEQLGLKLESSKGPVDVVVIDALEQPTAN